MAGTPKCCTYIHMEAGVIIVEGLTNLDAITKEKVMFIALPLKVAGGDGAPARVVAIEEDWVTLKIPKMKYLERS